MSNIHHSSDSGLTLVELLVVIALVGIVAAIAVPVLTNVLSRASAKADAISATERENFSSAWSVAGYKVVQNGSGWDAISIETNEIVATIK